MAGTIHFTHGDEPVATRGRDDRELQADARETAIADGIRWLAKEQREDGSWRIQVEPLPGDRSPCEATGLVLLAFLGAGQTTDTGKYVTRINHAVDFLESWADVFEGRADLRGDGGTLVSHGIAATALCELRGMTKSPDDRLRRLTEAAVQQSLAWQDGQSGGWGIQPDQPMHLRPTVWQMMLLDSAALAGIEVPQSAQRRARECLKAFQTADERRTDEGPFFGFTGPGNDPTATSFGAYGRLRHDWAALHPWSRRIADRLLDPDFKPLGPDGKYFANEILNRVGGVDEPENPAWSAWHRDEVRRLIRLQSQNAEQAGSWPPADASASRLQTTAYHLLTLEIYYRYRPLSLGGAFRASKTPGATPRADVLRDLGPRVRPEDLPPSHKSP